MGSGKNPFTLVVVCAVWACPASAWELDILGFGWPELPGESTGVTLVVGIRELAAACRVVLNTEETVLACELAEPTALRISPGGDSLSSGWSGAVSAN
jgi:hypothetical protein